MQDAENNWQFDVFGFAEAFPGQTLSMLGFHFYKQSGLIKHYQMDDHKMCNYLQKIEAGYDSSTPYHNRYPNAPLIRTFCNSPSMLNKLADRTSCCEPDCKSETIKCYVHAPWHDD